jgi:hypothetical protein
LIATGSHTSVGRYYVSDGEDAYIDPPSLIVTQDGERVFIVRPNKLHVLK